MISSLPFAFHWVFLTAAESLEQKVRGSFARLMDSTSSTFIASYFSRSLLIFVQSADEAKPGTDLVCLSLWMARI